MARSEIMKFWKLLADAKFTGRPSQLTEDDIRRMSKEAALFETEIETVLRGLREFKNEEE
jgi:hypothetical protein